MHPLGDTGRQVLLGDVQLSEMPHTTNLALRRCQNAVEGIDQGHTSRHRVTDDRRGLSPLPFEHFDQVLEGDSIERLFARHQLGARIEGLAENFPSVPQVTLDQLLQVFGKLVS